MTVSSKSKMRIMLSEVKNDKGSIRLQEQGLLMCQVDSSSTLI